MSAPIDDLGDGIIRAEASARSAPVDLSGIGAVRTIVVVQGAPADRVALFVNTGSVPFTMHGKLVRPGRMVQAIWSARWRRWVVRRWPAKVSR